MAVGGGGGGGSSTRHERSPSRGSPLAEPRPVVSGTNVQLKSPREIEIMARGGRILADTLKLLAERATPGISTGEVDAIAEEFIRSHAGAVPAFKGLYGFPGSACLSVNEEIVHGIPS